MTNDLHTMAHDAADAVENSAKSAVNTAANTANNWHITPNKAYLA
jgi:hypothetical protein